MTDMLVLLAQCCTMPVMLISPGILVAARMRLNPLEKICMSISLSLIFIYLVEFAVYLFVPVWFPAPVLVGVFSFFALLCGARRGDFDFLKSYSVQRILFPLLLLIVWNLILLCLIRNYSGGGWSGDWLEHLHRSVFFLNKLPDDTVIYGNYTLSARPPMMNMIAAYFMDIYGDGFDRVQLIFFLLNMCSALPLFLFYGYFSKYWAGKGYFPLVLFLCANPFFSVNATYLWTKLFSAYFVCFAFWLLLSGMRRKNGNRLIFAFVNLAAGVLAHYSAMVYLIFAGLVYLVYVLRRPSREKCRQFALSFTSSFSLFATWLLLSLLKYGPKKTFVSNTTADAVPGNTLDFIINTCRNIYYSLVPHFISSVDMSFVAQDNTWGQIRDWGFLIYQHCFTFAFGFAGVLMLAFVLFSRKCKTPETDLLFWISCVSFCTFTGIAVHPIVVHFGVAHVTLQPLVILGISFIAASFYLIPRIFSVLIISALVLDFSMGIFLQFSIQNLETDNSNIYDYHPIYSPDTGIIKPFGSGSPEISIPASTNWSQKHRLKAPGRLEKALLKTIRDPVRQKYIRDYFFRIRSHLIEEDNKTWGGYFSRHGGALTFLGDRLKILSGFFQSALIFIFLFLICKTTEEKWKLCGAS